MPKYRPSRFSGELQKEVARIINEEISDPRLNFVSVVKVEVSHDLSHAKVYVSSLINTPQEDLFQALASAKGFIRHKLAKIVQTRIVPELSFVADDSIAYGIKMSETIDRQLEEDRKNKGVVQDIED